MKDIISTEVIHPLATLVIPGAVCIAPALLLPGPSGAAPVANAVAAAGGSGVVFVLASVALGLVLENVGSRIEVCLDKRHTGCSGKHEERWHDYLSLHRSEDELVAHRYVDSLQLRLKFELSMIPALLLASFEWGMVCHELKTFTCLTFGLVLAAALVAAAYLLCEARTTVDVLCKTRGRMIAASKKSDQPAEMG